MDCEPTGDAQNHFAAHRVHLPRVPGLGEDMHRHQTTLYAVSGVALDVAGLPAHVASELGFDLGSGTESKMNRSTAGLCHLVGHGVNGSDPRAPVPWTTECPRRPA